MEDQAGLKLFSLIPPQRYSNVPSLTGQCSAYSLRAEDIQTPGAPCLSIDVDDAACTRLDADTPDTAVQIQMEDRSERALMRRWSTMVRLTVPSQVEEDTIDNLCLSTNLFACMDVDEAKDLYERGTVLQMSPGDVLVEQGGDVAPGIFLVIAGEVGVCSAYSSSRSQYTRIIKKWDIVAEDHIDLILDRKGNGKYCASFQVVDTIKSQCKLLQLSQSVLCSFFSSHPHILRSYIEDVMVYRHSVVNTVLRQELKIGQDEETAGRAASALSAKQHRLLEGLRESILQATQKSASSLQGMWKVLRDASMIGDPCTAVPLKCLETEASPSVGWDVIPGAIGALHHLPSTSVVLQADGVTEFSDDRCFVLAEGVLVAVRSASYNQGEMECALVTQGSLINAATFLTSESSGVVYFSASKCILKRLDQLWLGSLLRGQNEKLLSKSAESLATLTLLFGPTLRQFQGLGFQKQWLSAGQAIFCQDQAPDGFFKVVSGRMKFLQLAVDGSLHDKGVVSRGEWIGSKTGQPCKCSCMAMKDVELVCLKQDMLPLLSRMQPRALLLVYDKVMQKMERSEKDLKPCSRTIALIPGGIPSSCNAVDELQKDSDDFSSNLEDALSSYGSVCRITWDMLVQNFPEDSKFLHISFYRAKLTRWLSSMEEEHTFLLLVGSYTHSDWTTLCSAQADRVLVLGSPMNSKPDVSSIEDGGVWKPAKFAIETLKQSVTRYQTGTDVRGHKVLRSSISVILAGKSSSQSPSKLHQPQRSLTQNSRQSLASMRQIDLILIHDSDSTPSNAKSWLDKRPLIEQHYNIRKSSSADVQRIARWVSGNAIGVVLSGGGAPGLAHVGVLQALERLQIPIDAVGGTSQGSLVGALYAQGHNSRSIYNVIHRYASVCGSVLCMVLDLTLPILSVFNGRRFHQAIQDSISDGAQNIEDLRTSYFCVTTNLSTGEPHVHTRGVLGRAVRASMSIVGLVPPIIDENGHLICDGGYSDNLPVDAMRKMGASIVIAVDVENRDVSAWSNLSMPVEGVLSGWRILWDRWCPIASWTSGQRFPRQQHMLNALCGMAHSQNLANLARFVHDKHIDLYLRPPVLQYALLDWNFMEDIVSDSRSYSLAEISKWLKNTNAVKFSPSD